jgi:hypothetical protein
MTGKTLTDPELVELPIMARLDELIRAEQRNIAKSRPRIAADRFTLELTKHWLKARMSKLLGGNVPGKVTH